MTLHQRLLAAVLVHAEAILVGLALVALGFLLAATMAQWLR